jgi:serine/threonine protein kinase/predicted ATPase
VLQVAQVFADRFVVERFAGSGGMGRVFRARDRLTGEAVALKVMTDQSSAQRFLREGQLLSQLQHPAIVRYVAHGHTDEGLFYIAMEWVEGETLGNRLRGAGLTDPESVEVVRQLADALAVAHARGIVHRDIKPGNVILVGGDVQAVKLLDFGIAHLDDPTADVTRTGIVLGTVGYMAPEQARGVPQIDARADVFSLGALLFHCLSGRAPFAGGPAVAVLAKLVLEDAPRLSEQRAGLPPVLDDLVARMLSKDPLLRPAHGAEVAALLSEIRLEPVTRKGPESSAEEALTGSEQRLVSVLLASGLGDESASEWGSIAFEPLVTIVEGSTRDGPPVPVDSPAAVVRELRRIAARFGARLEPLRSGSLAVMLSGAMGSSGSATDLVARAARCALEMRHLLPATPMSLATGRGMVAAAFPVGEVIERAAELLGRAPSDTGIAVDHVTLGLLEARFDVSTSEGISLLQRERPHVETARRLLGKPTSTVGRERELGFLLSSFDECVSEPVARALLVTGPAGIGKSRVRYELLRRLGERHPETQIWIGRGDPIGAGSPFGLLSQALRKSASIRDGEPLAESQEKLRHRVAQRVPSAERARVTAFLAELARVPLSDTSSELIAARQDPILMGDQMRRAWEDFVQAECKAHPVLLVFEDLHWGDLPTVTYVDAALKFAKELPFMVLAFARPDVSERFPSLWLKRDLMELRLTPLTKKAGEKLVKEALGEDADPGLVARVVERADGNAFYLEELIRAVAEGESDKLPDTVLAMVQSRLEALPDGARRVLRAASVFGGVFWDAGVQALLGASDDSTEIRDWLGLLAKRELITERDQSGFPGSVEYVFRHALVREAGYGMLTPDDRERGHRLAGNWLEENGEPEPLVLAQHFEQGALPERALGWCRTAATEALEGNDLDAARHAVSRARQFAEKIGLSGPALGAIELDDAELRYWRAEHADAERHARLASELLEPGTPAWYHAMAVHVSAAHRCGHVETEKRITRTLIDGGHADRPSVASLIACTRVAIAIVQIGDYELADELFARFDTWAATFANDKAAQARWYAGLAARALYAGETQRYKEMSVTAARFCEAAGDFRSAATHRHNVGHSCLELGRFEEAEAELRETLVIAERVGLANVVASTQNNLGAVLTKLGQTREARALLELSIAELEKQSDRRMEGGARNHYAELLLEMGDAKGAVASAEHAVEILSLVPPLKIQALATLARARRALGETALALEVAQSGYRLLEELRSMADGEAMVRLVYAELLHEHGQKAAACEAIRLAYKRLMSRAVAMQSDVKETFLTRVWENKKTIERFEEWLGDG